MENLLELREKLDKIDKKMANLFEKRMEIIEKVRIFKKQNNLPILDSNRENTMLEKNSKYLNNQNYVPYYADFLKAVTGVSKQYMKDKNDQ